MTTMSKEVIILKQFTTIYICILHTGVEGARDLTRPPAGQESLLPQSHTPCPFAISNCVIYFTIKKMQSKPGGGGARL